MLRRSAAERELLGSATNWRKIATDTLSIEGVQAGLGLEQRMKFRKLAKRAGVIILSKSKIRTVPSQNGLYFIPTPPDLPEELALTVRQGKKSFNVNIGKLLVSEEHEAWHASIKGLQRMHFIGLPNYGAEYDDHEKAAIMVHELTHADQFKRDRGTRNSATVARDEAEAYLNQLIVIDYFWDGQLLPLVTINANNEQFDNIDVPDNAPLVARLNSSVTACMAVGVAARNATYGYIANGIDIPPPELVEEYRDLEIIRESWFVQP